MDLTKRASHFMEWRSKQPKAVDTYLGDECAQWGDVTDDEYHDVNMIEITEEFGYDDGKRKHRGKDKGNRS